MRSLFGSPAELSKFVDKIKASLKTPEEKVKEMMDKLNEAVRKGLLPFSAAKKIIHDLKDSLGFFDEAKKTKDFAKSVKDAIETPLQKFNKIKDQTEAAVKAGDLKRAEADKFLAEQRKSIFKEQMRSVGFASKINTSRVDPATLGLAQKKVAVQQLDVLKAILKEMEEENDKPKQNMAVAE